MTGPKFIPGGSTLVSSRGDDESKGVFSDYPGATKKYALNDGHQRRNFRETMARMFIQMSEKERKQFVDSVPEATRRLAEILTGVGTGASGGTGYIDFLLTNVSEQFHEKAQVVESMTDDYVVYLFGQGAPTFSYSGVLLNTYQDDQRVWMTRLYRDVLRGTQLARRRKLLRIRYDSVIVSGVMLNLNMSITADQEDRSPFSFSFVPTQYVIYTPSLASPTRLKKGFTPGSKYALDSTGVPSTNRTRVAAHPVPPALATRKRASEKDNSVLHVNMKGDPEDATKKALLKLALNVEEIKRIARGDLSWNEAKIGLKYLGSALTQTLAGMYGFDTENKK